MLSRKPEDLKNMMTTDTLGLVADPARARAKQRGQGVPDVWGEYVGGIVVVLGCAAELFDVAEPRPTEPLECECGLATGIYTFHTLPSRQRATPRARASVTYAAPPFQSPPAPADAATLPVALNVPVALPVPLDNPLELERAVTLARNVADAGPAASKHPQH